MIKVKCDICGKFVSKRNFRQKVYSEFSECSVEEVGHYCKECYEEYIK